eukprot:752264-Hanusia_phi.AAC.6
MTTCHAPIAVDCIAIDESCDHGLPCRNEDRATSCRNSSEDSLGPAPPCTCGHGTCAILGFCIREKSESLPREGPASPVERDRMKGLLGAQSSFKVLHVSDTEDLHELGEIINDKFKTSSSAADDRVDPAHVTSNFPRKPWMTSSCEIIPEETLKIANCT